MKGFACRRLILLIYSESSNLRSKFWLDEHCVLLKEANKPLRRLICIPYSSLAYEKLCTYYQYVQSFIKSKASGASLMHHVDHLTNVQACVFHNYSLSTRIPVPSFLLKWTEYLKWEQRSLVNVICLKLFGKHDIFQVSSLWALSWTEDVDLTSWWNNILQYGKKSCRQTQINCMNQSCSKVNLLQTIYTVAWEFPL